MATFWHCPAKSNKCSLQAKKTPAGWIIYLFLLFMNGVFVVCCWNHRLALCNSWPQPICRNFSGGVHSRPHYYQHAPFLLHPQLFYQQYCFKRNSLFAIRGLRRRILCPSQPFLYSLDCFLIGGMLNNYSGYVLKMLGVQSDAYMHSFFRI